mgnify:FL=1
MLQTCHGQHAQRQRPVNVLRTEVKGGAEERKVKGYLAQKAEQHQPPKVAFDVVGVHKALHQQKAEDRKGQPPGEAQHHVQPVQRIGGKGVPREGAAVQPGRKDTCLDAGRADVVHQHGDAGNGFKGGAAEAAARGKCGHKKHLGQFVKNRYKNYNGGKVAFPASAAAKSAQSVHKSAQNA